MRNMGEEIERSGVASPQLNGMTGLRRKVVDALSRDNDPGIDSVNDMSYHELYESMWALSVYPKRNQKMCDLQDQVRMILGARADVRSKLRASVEGVVHDW